MRRAVRAIIVKNNQLLVMHRDKFGEKYLTLPGGNIEMGETPEEALVRELRDETQFTISNLRMVFIEHCEHPYGDQLIYLAETSGGEPKLRPGCEEDLINKLGKNLYEPKWLPVHALENASFVTHNLKAHLIKALSTGWPDSPLEFTSKRQ